MNEKYKQAKVGTIKDVQSLLCLKQLYIYNYAVVCCTWHNTILEGCTK